MGEGGRGGRKGWGGRKGKGKGRGSGRLRGGGRRQGVGGQYRSFGHPLPTFDHSITSHARLTVEYIAVSIVKE